MPDRRTGPGPDLTGPNGALLLLISLLFFSFLLNFFSANKKNSKYSITLFL
jgi:hypothetical protein